MYKHILNIKTCNNPKLLKRLLLSIDKVIEKFSIKKSNIYIVVGNDTYENKYLKLYWDIIKAYKDKGYRIKYLLIRSGGVQKILENLKRDDRELVKSLFGFSFNSENIKKGFGGNICTHNLMSIVSYQIIKKEKLDSKKVIITYHDDDLIYSTYVKDEEKINNLLLNYFKRREDLITQGYLLLIGKYTGTSGSPVNLICDLFNFSHNVSKKQDICINWGGVNRFKYYNYREVLKYKDVILTNSLKRTPIIGTIYKQELLKRDIKSFVPDLGYYSIRGDLISLFPLYCFWINDFYISWKMNTLSSKRIYSREFPINHIRTDRDLRGSVIETNLFESATNLKALQHLSIESKLFYNQECFYKLFNTELKNTNINFMSNLKYSMLIKLNKYYQDFQLVFGIKMAEEYTNQVDRLIEIHDIHNLNNKKQIDLDYILNVYQRVNNGFWDYILNNFNIICNE